MVPGLAGYKGMPSMLFYLCTHHYFIYKGLGSPLVSLGQLSGS